MQEGEHIISEPKAVEPLDVALPKNCSSYPRMPGINTSVLSKLMMTIDADFNASVLKLFLRFCTH